jgi:1-acyl-sn-glycerol-3-phosphate acyltransferase
LKRIHTLFVERFDTQQAIADAARVADASGSGRAVLFFPEGTFTRSPGLLPFHMGAFAAAATTKTPIVPIVIRGTRSMLRAASWFPRPGRISVRIGAPIDPRHYGGAAEDDWALALKLRAAAREYMLHHYGEPDLSGDRPATS